MKVYFYNIILKKKILIKNYVFTSFGKLVVEIGKRKKIVGTKKKMHRENQIVNSQGLGIGITYCFVLYMFASSEIFIICSK